MRTLRGRLLVGTAIGTGLVLFASAAALYAVVRTALWREFDEALALKARSLAAQVEQVGTYLKVEVEEIDLPEFKPSPRAEYYEIWSASGDVVARSRSLRGANLAQVDGLEPPPRYGLMPLPDGRPGRFVEVVVVPRQEGDDDDRLRAGRQHHAVRDPLLGTLVVARDTLDIDGALSRLRLLLTCGCVGAILASVGVLSWFVGRGLRPVGDLAAEIASIGEADLSRRIETARGPGELAPIALRLNELLVRLEDAFAREKAFTADVAHELRTPLAGLRSTLEVSLSRERAAARYREAMAKSLAVCRQMQQMVENLLALARVDAGQLETAAEGVDLATLAKECWQPFAERAAERQLEVAWNLPRTYPVTTDPAKVRHILNNMYDNATTYVNAGGKVTVSARSKGRRVELVVANTGSKIAEGDADRVFDRFWRGDIARASQDGIRRYGLGLPLCRKLGALLGGEIVVSTTRGGTFRVSLVLSSS